MDDSGHEAYFQFITVRQSLEGASRLIKLATKSNEDEALLAACAVLFLQIVVEQGAEALAFFIANEGYARITALPLRERLRRIDLELERGFFDDRKNTQAISSLDRLITLRSRISHAKDSGRKFRLKDGRVVDLSTNEQVPLAASIKSLWRDPRWMRVSADDAADYYKAVIEFFEILDPGDSLNLRDSGRG